jgi:type II secretory pathway pseudopilin PulG
MVRGRHPRLGVGPRAQDGFTYLWLLAAIAVLGIGLFAVSEVWVTSARRQKMVELEWVGGQFTQAIGSYYQATPGAAKVYPASLQDLIEDRRYVTVRRHLRAVYANPFTGRPEWDLVAAADGRIRGVRIRLAENSGGMVREFIFTPTAMNQ